MTGSVCIFFYIDSMLIQTHLLIYSNIKFWLNYYSHICKGVLGDSGYFISIGILTLESTFKIFILIF